MKKDLRVLKTKSSLNTALVQLLHEKSLDKISISELCKTAQINRGTFYLHYQGIVELFEEYFADITEDLRKAYYEPYLLTDNKIENLEPDMVRIFHHIEKYKDFYKVVFNRKTPLVYYYQLFEIVRGYIYESVSITFIQEDLTCSYSSSFQANAIIGLIIEWMNRDFEQTPNEMNELLLQITNNTLRWKMLNNEGD